MIPHQKADTNAWPCSHITLDGPRGARTLTLGPLEEGRTGGGPWRRALEEDWRRALEGDWRRALEEEGRWALKEDWR